ncbi:MAG TPA: 3-deoxy-7-phosphoheptulonate synthase [Candidatus Krumholzibacteria bacterium]|nr:3-deoxy-7-phosphoheptulonate synthase [Candidatus Krumholzibacteria bacterium]
MRTDNLNVLSLTPLTTPAELRRVYPLADGTAQFVTEARSAVKAILTGQDPRLLAVVGPCSIHDPAAAVEYARRLAGLAAEIRDRIYLVMRVYFEKPRTTVGWKGLINDPDLNGSHEISKGLGIARGLLGEINALGVPVAGEMLDTITPEYLADLITWGAIGARTTESQLHREMASGLSFPVGFKNGTDGNLQIAFDAMKAAMLPHSFVGINRDGRTSIVRTTGNAHVHIVLRGGGGRPNYYAEDVAAAAAKLEAAGLPGAIMVDCSHANSSKNHERQVAVLEDVVRQRAGGARTLRGVMIESNLEAGSQKIPDDLAQLKYGVSVTDACVDWATTERMLRAAAAGLAV